MIGCSPSPAAVGGSYNTDDDAVAVARVHNLASLDIFDWLKFGAFDVECVEESSHLVARADSSDEHTMAADGEVGLTPAICEFTLQQVGTSMEVN